MQILEVSRSAGMSSAPLSASARGLDVIRADFERRTNRSMSMPLAGTVIWCVIAILGVVLPPRMALFALLSGTGMIFPLALVIAKIRKEEFISNKNEFAGLMVASTFMVNLLWAVHIPLLFRVPSLVPLSLGIGLGIHWVVYSWVIRHPLGYVHATLRTIGVFCAWLFFPTHSITACASVVVATYCITLWQMATRHIDKPTPGEMTEPHMRIRVS